MCPYVYSSKFSVLAPRCSRALLHNLQPTSDCRLIFASHLATGMVPAIAIIFRPLCLQGRRGSFKYFPKNALLSFCRTWSLPSTCHMQGDWYCLALPELAHMISRIFCHQSKCSAARSLPCFGTMPRIVAYVCSPLCHHLYTIFCIVAWVCSFVSKHLWASHHVFAPHSLLFVLHPSRYY